MTTLFALVGAFTVFSSIVYMLLTRGVGTPLRDAIMRDPGLLRIRDESKRVRMSAFCKAAAVAIVFIYLFRPMIFN